MAFRASLDYYGCNKALLDVFVIFGYSEKGERSTKFFCTCLSGDCFSKFDVLRVADRERLYPDHP